MLETTRAMIPPISKPYHKPRRAWAKRRLLAARSRAAWIYWSSLMAFRYHALFRPLSPVLNNRHLRGKKVPEIRRYCFSYSPLPTRLRTVKPAFLASEIEADFGALKLDQTLRTGFLHAGQFVRCGAERSEEHTSELQSRLPLVCSLLLE